MPKKLFVLPLVGLILALGACTVETTTDNGTRR